MRGKNIEDLNEYLIGLQIFFFIAVRERDVNLYSVA